MTARFPVLILFVLLGACTDPEQQSPAVATDTSSQNQKTSRVALSHAPGFHDQPIAVRLSHPDPDATIYYTLDGSDPDPANTAGSSYRYKNLYSYRLNDPFGPLLENRYQTHRYHQPIQVADRSSEPDRYSRINTTVLSGLPRYFPAEIPLSKTKQEVNGWLAGLNRSIARFNGWWTDVTGGASPRVPSVPLFQPPEPRHLLKGTVIRAAAFKNGEALGEATTASYFVMPRNTFQLPVLSLVAPEERLFGYEKGILVAGQTHDRFRQETGQQRATGNAPANWMHRGKATEIPAHLQYFSHRLDPTRPSVDQGVGIRVHGGVNRAAASKSLRIYARKQYGKATLRHAFFDEEQKYKRLLLRNSGNDFYHTFMRDAAIQQIMSGLRFDTQAYQPSVVFVNGEYWGLLNLREYYDKHYLSRVHQVDKDRLDIMDLDKADEGDDAHWNELMAFIASHPLEDARHYAHVAERIDIDNLIDYLIANIFVVNYDWPHNNMRYWRLRTDEPAGRASSTPSAPSAQDGRWRWLMFDTDAGFRDFRPDSLRRLVTMSGKYETRTHLLVRSLLKNKQFKEAYIVRFSDLLNTSFKTEHMASVIDRVRAGIEGEMPRHIERWAIPDNLEVWDKGVNHLQTFVRERPPLQRQQLARFFGLQGEYRLTLKVSDTAHGRVRVNSTTIDTDTPGVTGAAYPWSGTYFKRMPLEIEAQPAPCFSFSHWDGDPGLAARITLQPEADLTLTAVFQRSCTGN